MIQAAPDQRLSDWADQHFYLSAESSGTEGPWRTLPYQRAIMNVIGGDYTRTNTLMKCARVGYTKMICAAVAYWVSHKRRSGAIWQPVDGDAVEFKKDEIQPMLRDVPALRDRMIASDPEKKSKHNTEDRIAFDGALLYVRGGKSARNYRRLTLDFAIYDELSGFEPDIDKEGSATALGDVRLTASSFPKSVRGSTPKTHLEDQIERSLEQADVVFRRAIPCPHCDSYHTLQWSNFHYDKADIDRTARFHCPTCSGGFFYAQYAELDERGRWVDKGGNWIDEDAEEIRTPDGDTKAWPAHVGFFIWAAHSYVQSWARLAELWIEANAEKKRTGDDKLLKTFVNTQLAETWKDIETAIDGEQLYLRREQYAAEVPSDALVLTMGVDTQNDRLELEVVGHGQNGETFGIAYKVLHGDPASGDVFAQLDAEIDREYLNEHGARQRVIAVGIDSGGHRTREVYEYCRTRHARRVYCLKGQGGEGVPVHKAPSNIKIQGARTVKLYSIGVDSLKERWIANLQRSPGQHGYVHLPMAYSLDWCEQATSEVLVSKFERGKLVRKWQKLRTRNEALDCRQYAHAAVEILNPRLDLIAAQSDDTPEPEQPESKPAPSNRARKARRDGYINKW